MPLLSVKDTDTMSKEERTKPKLRERLWTALRAKTLTGIAVLVPIVLTFLVLRTVFQWIDGLAQPFIRQVFQTQGDVPGLGIVLTLLLIWLAGMVAGNVIGRRIIGRGHEFLSRLPILGNIYGPVKQFIEQIVAPSLDSEQAQKTGFRQVVLVEYPSEGLWIVGFSTGEIQFDAKGNTRRCVFIPTSPNPLTGWMVILPPEKVRETALTVEAAFQLVVSAGIVIPKELRDLGAYDPKSSVSLKLDKTQ